MINYNSNCILSVKVYSLDRPELLDDLVDFFTVVDLVELVDLFTGVVDLDGVALFIVPDDFDPELLL